uniref:LysM peptidoglycan-binding domain-containing protein n=1 Tax=Fervidobacterium thailandense TaxID=1008305 RepID=A0A7C4CDQ1_9BACT
MRSTKLTQVLVSFLMIFMIISSYSLANTLKESRLIIVHTANIYGDLTPTNYFTSNFEQKGAAYLVNYLRNLRTKYDSVLAIDTGNLLYGSPFGDYYLNVDNNPVLKIFNILAYDFFIPGTFELGMSTEQLEKIVASLKPKTLAANLKGIKGAASYSIITLKNGVKVAVIGIVAENGNHSFVPYLDVAKRIVEDIRKNRRADVVVIATSAGVKTSPATSNVRSLDSKFAFGDQLIKELSGSVDVFLFGNQSLTLVYSKNNKVYSLPPSNGRGLNQIELVLSRDAKGWKITRAQVKLVDFKMVTPDEVILEELKNYEAELEKWLDEPVGSVPSNVPFHKYMAIIEDNPAIEFVARNLMKATQANLAVWNVFNPNFFGLSAGDLTRRTIYQLVGTVTTLKVLKIKGSELEKLLSQIFKYVKYENGILVLSKEILGSPWKVDLFEGVSYDLVINKGVVRNVTVDNKPLEVNKEYMLVVPTVRTQGADRIAYGKVIMEVEQPVSLIILNLLSSCDNEKVFTLDFNRRTLAELEYVVKPGDTLRQLEWRLGVPQWEIMQLNPFIKNPNLLRPGWKLIYYRSYLELVPPLQNFFIFNN